VVDDADIERIADFECIASVAELLEGNLDRMFDPDPMLRNSISGRDDPRFGGNVRDRRGDDEINLAFGVTQLQVMGALIIGLAVLHLFTAHTSGQERQVLWIVDEGIDVPAEAVIGPDHKGRSAAQDPVRGRLTVLS
jgi:hypothetical protein